MGTHQANATMITCASAGLARAQLQRRHVMGAPDEAHVRALSAAQVLRARWAATMFPFSV
jgi:hypothetical protein